MIFYNKKKRCLSCLLRAHAKRDCKGSGKRAKMKVSVQ